jgi:hypothetical protein
LELIPSKIIHKYNLRDLVNNQGWVYIEIQMGMYVLPQASILANTLLKKCLNAKGYYECQHTPGLWRQFGVNILPRRQQLWHKTTSLDHIMHLKTTLQEHYTVTMAWDGLLFCNVNINWNYTKHTPSPSTCQNTSPRHSSSSNIQFRFPRNTNLTNTFRYNPGPKFRGWTSIRPTCCPQTLSNASKISLALFCTTDAQSI